MITTQRAINLALQDIEYFSNKPGRMYCKLFVNTYWTPPINNSVVVTVHPSPDEQKVEVRHYYMYPDGTPYVTTRSFA